uniref:Protein FAM3C-like isoform X2 n=1 Tax=Petromyzon marinus TaxID=7757 RepID=A0AAJ7UE60_PETMA|nr:protein FAM3C-like isoform X2 [Petromyzon marinus]
MWRNRLVHLSPPQHAEAISRRDEASRAGDSRSSPRPPVLPDAGTKWNWSARLRIFIYLFLAMSLLTKGTCVGAACRVALVVCCCSLAWLLGATLAHMLANASEHGEMRYLAQLRAPPRPSHNRCGLMSQCSRSEFAFSVFSGAGTDHYPRVCLDDRMIMSRNRNNVGRGINIVGINSVTGEVTDSRVFDMWGHDCADEVVQYLESVTDGTILFMASHDEASTYTNEKVRAALGQLGSTKINELRFRDSWVLVTAKGYSLGRTYEQIVHKDEAVHHVGDWPMEAQTEGCLSHRT